MGRPRIDLRQHGTVVRLRWLSGSQASHDHISVWVGQITTDGRWYLHASRNPDGALICADMADAIHLARTWMTKSGRTWRPHPPAFKSISEPADPDWRREHDRLEAEALRGDAPGRSR